MSVMNVAFGMEMRKPSLRERLAMAEANLKIKPPRKNLIINKPTVSMMNAVERVLQSKTPQEEAQVIEDSFNMNETYQRDRYTNLFNLRYKRSMMHWIFNGGIKIDNNNKASVIDSRLKKDTLIAKPGIESFCALKDSITTALSALLQWNINIDDQDFCGNTGLHYAVKHQNLKSVQLLLESGANPNIKNQKGNIPVMELLAKKGLSQLGVADIVRLLLKFGSDIYSENYKGESLDKLARIQQTARNESLKRAEQVTYSEYILTKCGLAPEIEKQTPKTNCKLWNLIFKV